MAQADGVVANGTGSAVRADINGQLAALFTNHSGSTAPATTFAFQTWADTNTNTLKLRNSSNDGWVQLARLDGQFDAKTFHGNVTLNAQSDLRLADSDSSNWVAFQAPATVASNVTWTLPAADGTSGQTLQTNGSGTLSWSTPSASTDIITEGNTSAEVVDTGSDGHFKVVTEGTEALRVDSSQRVGIGTTSPSEKLELSGTGSVWNKITNGTVTGYVGVSGSGASFDLYGSTNHPMRFFTNGDERARIDSSGRLLIGSTGYAIFDNSTTNPKFQFRQTSGDPRGAAFIEDRGDSSGFNLYIAKSRGGSGTTIVNSEDQLGSIQFTGADGTNQVSAASIFAYVDGTPGADDMPGRLVFSTTADGASSPTERLRITKEGFVNVNDSGVIYNSDGYTNAQLFVYDVRQGGHAGTFVNNNVNYDQANHGVLWAGCSRSASSGYVLFAASSGNGNSLNYGADLEFRLYGNGNGKCDGSWTGGGADYAEMFEWVDGNPDAEDRRGLSVVLEGNKIRAAVDGDDPIGVISANPTILGDAAWNKWTEKHLRDDFGSYVLVDHNVIEWVDENGETHSYEDWNIPADVVVPDDAVISTHDGNGKRFTHRAVNPAYDPDREYVPREERQEWDAVGLMGKLRIRKGQVTGARWIKMRDISDSVEEWLVR